MAFSANAAQSIDQYSVHVRAGVRPDGGSALGIRQIQGRLLPRSCLCGGAILNASVCALLTASCALPTARRDRPRRARG